MLRLSHEGAAAERINGHLTDEDTGHLIERFANAHVQNQPGALMCTFTLSAELAAQRVCMIIEGQRAGSDPGGCEMCFTITN